MTKPKHEHNPKPGEPVRYFDQLIALADRIREAAGGIKTSNAHDPDVVYCQVMGDYERLAKENERLFESLGKANAEVALMRDELRDRAEPTVIEQPRDSWAPAAIMLGVFFVFALVGCIALSCQADGYLEEVAALKQRIAQSDPGYHVVAEDPPAPTELPDEPTQVTTLKEEVVDLHEKLGRANWDLVAVQQELKHAKFEAGEQRQLATIFRRDRDALQAKVDADYTADREAEAERDARWALYMKQAEELLNIERGKVGLKTVVRPANYEEHVGPEIKAPENAKPADPAECK